MDIARPDITHQQRKRRTLVVIVVVLVLGAVTVGISRLKPALPMLESPAFTGIVKRGEMLREVRGHGILVPEEIRWITATSAGSVERILLLPGEVVRADTVLVELSNPVLEQEVFEAESQWKAGESQTERLKVQVESERLTQQSLVASLKSDLSQAGLEAEADEALFAEGLVPKLTAKRSRNRADELEARLQIELKRLEISGRSAQAQLKEKETEVVKFQKQFLLKSRQLQALKVKAGFEGVLQRLGDEKPLQVGQQVLVGANIARIANPARLKAEIKIAETQARDIQHGQVASIDTRNGVISGRVVRIDPASQNGTRTVDIKLDAPLPRGAVPDLNVDGIITLERLDNVLFVGRPGNVQADSFASLFKVMAGGNYAIRTRVKFGRTSINGIEVIEGLQAGDQIILSDMSQYDRHQQVRLK